MAMSRFRKIDFDYDLTDGSFFAVILLSFSVLIMYYDIMLGVSGDCYDNLSVIALSCAA